MEPEASKTTQSTQHNGTYRLKIRLLCEEFPYRPKFLKYANEAYTPHSLRHTAAMLASTKGTISEVSKLLRHKSIRVTTIYLEHLDIESGDHLTNELADDLLV